MAPGARTRRIFKFALAFVGVVVVDQLTKALVRSLLVPGVPVTLVPGVMDACLVYNEGAAFSMGEGFAWVFVAAAALIALGCAAYTLFGSPGAALSCSLGVIAGGGVGNLVDRVAYGSVTDFFMPTFVDFAVFNVADIAITCGFVVAFALFWREDAARERARAAAAAEEGRDRP